MADQHPGKPRKLRTSVKGPLMFSILWYSAFAYLSGFSTSYRILFGLRALFGIGMGGVWAAGMPLAIEHWPAHLRGRAVGRGLVVVADGDQIRQEVLLSRSQ